MKINNEWLLKVDDFCCFPADLEYVLMDNYISMNKYLAQILTIKQSSKSLNDSAVW